MSYLTDQDDVQFSEPIVPQKDVKLQIGFAEKTEWESKTKGVKNGKKFAACKLTLEIIDDSVRCEHADAKPKRTIEDQFNIESFPYEDKKTGAIKKLGRDKLYQLEAAFGFDPVFLVNGKQVEPFVTRNGNKVAPKIDGVKRVLNPDFAENYFDADGNPRIDNFIGKVVYANVGLETSEQYGSKNTIDRYVKGPSL